MKPSVTITLSTIIALSLFVGCNSSTTTVKTENQLKYEEVVKNISTMSSEEFAGYMSTFTTQELQVVVDYLDEIMSDNIKATLEELKNIPLKRYKDILTMYLNQHIANDEFQKALAAQLEADKKAKEKAEAEAILSLQIAAKKAKEAEAKKKQTPPPADTGSDDNTDDDTATNTPATFSGDDEGSVKEDDVLRDAGTLDVTDPDDGEEKMQAGTVDGKYGSLTIDEDGEWEYNLDNDNADVQALDDGETLTESITVRSLDGTAKAITLTVNGTNDGGNGSGGQV